MIKETFLGVTLAFFFLMGTIILMASLEGYPNTQALLLFNLFLLLTIITIKIENVERRRKCQIQKEKK